MLENDVIGLSQVHRSENLFIAPRTIICVLFDRIPSFNGYRAQVQSLKLEGVKILSLCLSVRLMSGQCPPFVETLPLVLVPPHSVEYLPTTSWVECD